MFTRLFFLFTLTSLVLFTGCKPDDDPTEEPEIDFSSGFFTLNEGNFNAGNASLFFTETDGQTYSNVFERQTGRPLGDVAQSIYLFEDHIYIVVNNSGKIERLDRDVNSVCAINGLVSPREMVFLSSEKAYVTDLYGNAITIVNPSNCSITGSIPTRGWTEGIVAHDGLVYAAGYDARQIYIIDPQADQIIDSMYTGYGPVSLAVDPENELWVLCDGGVGVERATLQEFDLATRTEKQGRRTFDDIDESPSSLVLSPNGRWLYYINGQRFMRQETNQLALVGDRFGYDWSGQFYSLAVHPTTGAVYATDAQDYVQRGNVLRWQSGDESLEGPDGEWKVGIIPGDILFVGE